MTPEMFLDICLEPIFLIFSTGSTSDNFVQMAFFTMFILGSIGLLIKFFRWR
jgi:hypothetical protein